MEGSLGQKNMEAAMLDQKGVQFSAVSCFIQWKKQMLLEVLYAGHKGQSLPSIIYPKPPFITSIQMLIVSEC